MTNHIYKVRNVAPFINTTFSVVGTFWSISEGVRHRGIDITTGASVHVYSIIDGYVHSKGFTDTAGYWIIIKNPNTGVATRYLHLLSLPLLPVGQNVSKGDDVGIEGSSGQTTGIHLHVEMQNMGTSDTWIFSDNILDYMNPAEYMGIDNILHTRWTYDPDRPYNYIKRSNFPWVLVAEKLRKQRKLTKK